MSWTRPTKGWQWTLLASPAVASLLALWASYQLLPPIPPLIVGDGRRIANISAILGRDLDITLATILVCSVPVAIFFTRRIPVPKRVASAILLALVLTFVNLGIAFAGCSVGGILL